MRSSAALLAAVLPLACASPPPAAAPTPTVDPAAAAALPPSAAPAAPGPPPSARVTAVVPAKDGGTRAKVVFSNPSGRPCRFTGYTLSWGSAHKTITLEGFTLQPGETRERWMKVGPEDGNVDALTPDASTVEVKAECVPRP